MPIAFVLDGLRVFLAVLLTAPPGCQARVTKQLLFILGTLVTIGVAAAQPYNAPQYYKIIEDQDVRNCGAPDTGIYESTISSSNMVTGYKYTSSVNWTYVYGSATWQFYYGVVPSGKIDRITVYMYNPSYTTAPGPLDTIIPYTHALYVWERSNCNGNGGGG